MWNETIQVSSLEDALQVLSSRGERARVVAGGTDLILELERGVRPEVDTLVDITRARGLGGISFGKDGLIHLGAQVTHNEVVASALLRRAALPLVAACWQVGSPQIRNRGTVGGNLITASPANDTIGPLMALGGKVLLRSSRGERWVSLAEFYQGVRRTVMAPDEMLVEIAFPMMDGRQKGTFMKYALRKAQAISVVNFSVVLSFDEHDAVASASITLGSVAPTVVHASEAEAFLVGKALNEEVIREASERVQSAAKPISDLRGSADFRRYLVGVLAQRALRSVASGSEREGIPEHPVLLRDAENEAHVLEHSIRHGEREPIETRINGLPRRFDHGQNKTLLRVLREEGGLTGTKEGCAEGECGACTVFLDGRAVMSCLVPAARAHGAEITTIEGLAPTGELNRVQEAFVEEGGVQCGYCTPGFIMAATKLLEEVPSPDQEQIRQAITGNLCRCTGYYKIVEAIEKAAQAA